VVTFRHDCLASKAIAKAKSLEASEQDALAKLMLEEMEREAKWEAVLANSPEKLAKLGDAAWAEHEAGLSQPLDPDRL